MENYSENNRKKYQLKKNDLVFSGKNTGYASIDKPWLKFYDNEAIDGEIPQKKIYDYMKDIISKNKDCYSYEFFGKKITNLELLKNIDMVSSSLVAQNVKKGDIVSLISVTSPEAIYTIYALNKIGAICNIIDPRLSLDNLKEKTAFSTLIISIDLVSSKVDKLLNENNKIVYFSISESFPLISKILYRIKHIGKNIKEDVNKLKWQSFLNEGHNVKAVPNTTYVSNEVAVIVSTSGTTGKSKLAQLTNENINAVAWQYAHSGIQHKLGDTFLNIMPLFLSYGIVAGIHMPLTLGFKTVIIPRRDLSKMGSYLLKHKPQAYLDVPAGYDCLLKDKRIHSVNRKQITINGIKYTITFEKSADLSFLNNPGVGGDHLNENLEAEVNKFLNEHNSSSKIQKGYGMTEVSSAAIVNVDEQCNSLNSVGVPLPKTNVMIVEPETLEELKYNQVGELLISSPAIFKGYLNDIEATNKEITIDANGCRWMRTGDLLKISENGELYFIERMKSMFVRPDGHNNHPSIINDLILKHPKVEDAFTVGVQIPNQECGKYPKTVIVLKKEFVGFEDEVQKELEDMCLQRFSQRDVPYFYEFRDSLPITMNGKVDAKALEDEGLEGCRYADIYINEYGKPKVKKK